METEKAVGVAEVAEYLGITPHTVYMWTKDQKKGFPVHKAGRSLKFYLSEVAEWLKKN